MDTKLHDRSQYTPARREAWEELYPDATCWNTLLNCVKQVYELRKLVIYSYCRVQKVIAIQKAVCNLSVL